MKDIEQRRASRLILLDPEGRVLFFRHSRKDGTTFWATPGGGLQTGETFEQAALREAAEELGLRGFPIKFLWQRMTDFMFVEGPVHQHECFFLLEGELPPLSAEVQKIHELEGIVEMRWWSTKEIESTAESVFPEGIVSELKKISN